MLVDVEVFFLFQLLDDHLIHYDIKKLIDDTGDAEVFVVRKEISQTCILEKQHTFDIFHRHGNDFAIKKRLNTFSQIGYNSKLIFLSPNH